MIFYKKSRVRGIAWIYFSGYRRTRSKERANTLAEKAVVEGAVMVRDLVDLIGTVAFKLQNEE